MNRVGVGIIGASLQGWAATAHVPAIQNDSHDFQLRAVAIRRAESAEAGARAFDAPSWYADYRALISDPSVELVVVAVNVPGHADAVDTALAAGKMVLCEWPLAANLNAATDLVEQALAARVRTAIGLQARFAPAVQRARELLTDGYIGKVMGTSLTGSAALWGRVTPQKQLYAFDSTNGATALTTTTDHALDAMAFVLGEFTSVTARHQAKESHGRGKWRPAARNRAIRSRFQPHCRAARSHPCSIAEVCRAATTYGGRSTVRRAISC